MGVINFTPNSFSDSSGALMGPIVLKERLDQFSKLGVRSIDIGAESTAPTSGPISADDEIKRLEFFLNSVTKEDLNFPFISLDTYKYEVAAWFFRRLEKFGLSADSFIWNDVSGKLDSDVELFFKEFPRSRYILCHNMAPSRQLASMHMDYADNKKDIFSEVLNFFKSSQSHPDSERIILDPCFGFSKSFEQNLQLIARFSELAAHFPHSSWVYGVSKKSFLRKIWQQEVSLNQACSREELLQKSEFIHHELLGRVMQSFSGKKLFFRVHDPLVYRSALILNRDKSLGPFLQGCCD